MRINNVGPVVVLPPEVRGSVDEVRATQPIGAQAAAAYSGGRILIETMAPQPVVAPVQERRRAPRRADDRRKQQVPVLIDTRVAERRLARRRTDDEPARSVDVEV